MSRTAELRTFQVFLMMRGRGVLVGGVSGPFTEQTALTVASIVYPSLRQTSEEGRVYVRLWFGARSPAAAQGYASFVGEDDRAARRQLAA